MSLDSQLKELEFAQKRPFDYACLNIAHGPSAVVSIDMGITCLLGAYLNSGLVSETINSTIGLFGARYTPSQELFQGSLQIGIGFLSTTLSMMGVGLITSYIRQKNIEGEEKLL